MEKIIHQTWKTQDIPFDIYPEIWQKSWKEQHPDWRYILHTDADNEELVQKEYPEFWDAFQTVNIGVVRADLCRMLYLHKWGGIYADLDFVCLKPFDELCALFGKSIMVGGMSRPDQPIPNAFMASQSGNEFWLKCVHDSLQDWNSGQRVVEAIAGPDRLKLSLDIYQPDHVQLPCSMIYPFVWGNPSADVEIAKIDKTNIQEVREFFPDGHAVTFWSHNW